MPDSHSVPRHSATPLYAEWENIKERIRWAVESVLIEDDAPNGQAEWAQEVAEQVVEATMLHLDGYEVDDLTPKKATAPHCGECGRRVRRHFGAWWCEVHRDLGIVKWVEVGPDV